MEKEETMAKEFLQFKGKLYRLDSKTGDIQRVIYEDINNTLEAKELIAHLVSLSADKLQYPT
jgi:hypothetical protein